MRGKLTELVSFYVSSLSKLRSIVQGDTSKAKLVCRNSLRRKLFQRKREKIIEPSYTMDVMSTFPAFNLNVFDIAYYLLIRSQLVKLNSRQVFQMDADSTVACLYLT